MKTALPVTRLARLAAAIALLGSAGALSAQVQDARGYPMKPVRLIVPFAPGGGVDIVARSVVVKLAELSGQQFVVDNRGGGGTVIGTELVARATPDGYTLLFGSTSLATNPALNRKLPYDTVKDFIPVSQASFQAYVLAVHPGVPASSVKEFIALAKAKPNTLNFGSPGLGTGSQLAAELLKVMTGTQMVHVPYKGSGPALADVIAGQIQFIMGTILSTSPHVKSGRLRALGVSSEKRVAVLPDVPTISEAGLQGYEATSWNGVLAPRGAPRPVVTRLHSLIAEALASPDVRERLMADGGEPVGSSPEQFARFIRAEIEKWTKVVKSAGITLN
jgi:tripartite-type tricarboxylate transporter receptor subunit TctC